MQVHVAQFDGNAVSGSAKKILSVAEYESMKRLLLGFGEGMEQYFENFKNTFAVFNNNNVVQSFYSSGSFGQDKQKQLEKQIELLKQYYDIINNNLVKNTNLYIDRQINLLNSK